MADINLNSFKSALRDGFRPNRFIVIFPTSNNKDISFFVKSASLPGRNMGTIPVNWMGMQLKFAGDPTFDDWTITFIYDYDGKARQFIEEWLETIFRIPSGEREILETYAKDIVVKQLGRSGEVIGEIKLLNAFPYTMDAVDLSMDNTDTFAEFTVTFAYSHWERLS